MKIESNKPRKKRLKKRDLTLIAAFCFPWMISLVLIFFFFEENDNFTPTFIIITFSFFMIFLAYKLIASPKKLPSVYEFIELPEKNKERVHFKVLAGYRCCGDVDLICKKCGHRGLDLSEPDEFGIIEFTCPNPECRHYGYLPKNYTKWQSL
jgi:hypothetical protein